MHEKYAYVGYEVSVSFCDSATDRLLHAGIQTALNHFEMHEPEEK